jgi:hypothetical protein
LPDDAASVPSVEGRQHVRLTAAGDPQPDAPNQSYTDGAKHARGRAVGALVPSRLATIALAAAILLAMVGACLALHALSGALASVAPGVDLAPLRLDRNGSMAHWLASTLLVVAAALAMFVYSLRRHRVDDYHGRYRVWLWTCAACLVASLVETTGLDRTARDLCGLVAKRASVSNDVLWPSIAGILGGGIGLRLYLEIRRSRAAVGTWAASSLSFAAALAAYQGWPLAVGDAGLPYWARGSWLVGYVLVLTTFLLYARYVQLDVGGSLARRTKKKRIATRTETDENSQSEPPRKPALRLRTDLEPVESAPSAAAKSAHVAAASATNDPQQANRHLSRAERRRLRREARMAS